MTKKKFEADALEREEIYKKKEESIRLQQKKLSTEIQATIEERVADKIKSERQIITELEAKKARQALSDDIAKQIQEAKELREQIKQKDIKLADSQKAEVELRKKQRDLDDKLRELALEVEKKC